jgi:hypothetical protein
MSNFEFVSLARSVSVQFGATTSEAATAAATSTLADVSRHHRDRDLARRLAGASSSVNMLWCARQFQNCHTQRQKQQKNKAKKKQKKQKKFEKNNLIFQLFFRRIEGDAIELSDVSHSGGVHLRIASSGCLWRDVALLSLASGVLLLVALEAHSSALHVFLVPSASPFSSSSASASVSRRVRLAGPPVPTGGASCLDVLVGRQGDGDALLVGLNNGTTRCVRFGADGVPLASFELQAASVVARLIGGLVPTLVGSRTSSAVLSTAVVPTDADTLVVGACADWQLRVWSVSRRACVLALPLTPETRSDDNDADDAGESEAPPLLLARYDAASGRVVVLMGGRGVQLQCQLFSLAVGDDGRPKMAVQLVLFAPTHAGAAKLAVVDVIAVQCRVWLLCADGAESLLFSAALPPADSDAVECGHWLQAASAPRSLAGALDGGEPAQFARRLVAACGVAVVEQVLTQLHAWPAGDAADRPLVERVCAVAAQLEATAPSRDAPLAAREKLTRLCVAARSRAELPLALAALRGGVPIVVGAHAFAVVRDATVPERLWAQSRAQLPSPLAPSPSVYEAADVRVDAAARREAAVTHDAEVGLLLRCVQQARTQLGDDAFLRFEATVLAAATDLDQAAYEHVSALLCTTHGDSAHFVDTFASLSDPVHTIDALLSALDSFDGQRDSPAIDEPDVVDARKAWLVRAATDSALLLDAAAHAARSSAGAALRVALGVLLVLYSVLRRVGAARLSPAALRRLRGSTLTRAKRAVDAAALVASALSADVTPRADVAASDLDADAEMATAASPHERAAADCTAVALARQVRSRLCGLVARSAALETALERGDVVGTSPLGLAPLLGRALTLSCRHAAATALALLDAQQFEAVLAYAPFALRLVAGEPVVRHCAALAALSLGAIDAERAARELEAVGPSLTRPDALLLFGDAPPLSGLDDAAAQLDGNALQDARVLAGYYMHVLTVLEARRLAPQAVRFAELALPYARLVDARAAASLRATVFRLHLSLDAFEAAYRSMLGHAVDAPSMRAADCDAAVRANAAAAADATGGDESALAATERWRGDALRRLVVVLCERGALRTLCELPFVGMVEQVRELLFAKAQHAPLDVKPDFYAILYAFTVYRGDYRRAATAMYECATRLALETASGAGDAAATEAALRRRVDALDATLTALRLAEPQSRWLPRVRTVAHQSPKRALDADEAVLGIESAEQQRTSLDIVALADIERERAMAAASAELVRVDAALAGVGSGELAADDAVVLLCHKGEYARALSLARQCGADMSPVFDSLAAACAALRCESLTVDDDMVLAGDDAGGGVPSTPVAAAWHALRCYLAAYDGAATGHAMYSRVAARILSLDSRTRLPHWLRATLARENPAALLRVYLAFANVSVLKDACDLIDALLHSPNKTWLPLNHIDSVLALLRQCSDASLRVKHDELRQSISAELR